MTSQRFPSSDVGGTQDRPGDSEGYDADVTADLLMSDGSQEGDANEDQVDGTEEDGGEDEDEQEETEGQTQLLSPVPEAKPRRSVHFEDDEYYDTLQPACSRAISVATASLSTLSSPRSPLLQKFARIQDRRVNTVLLEALHLIELSRDEISLIERSAKRLRDAILGFALLVDKQVNLVGGEGPEERGRVKADIQDLCRQLKTSNALLDSTCDRMKKHLVAGNYQLNAHKRRLASARAVAENADTECTSPRCSANSQRETEATKQMEMRLNSSPPRPSVSPSCGEMPYGCRSTATKSYRLQPKPKLKAITSPASSVRSSTTSTGQQMPVARKVPLACILNPRAAAAYYDGVDLSGGLRESEPAVVVTPQLFVSLLDTAGLQEKEFLELKELAAFLRELLSFFISRSPTLRFMDKAFHRRLIPRYTRELVELVVQDLQLTPQNLSKSRVVTPVNTLEDYVCTQPFRFDELLFRVQVTPTDESTPNPSPNGFFTPPPFADAAQEAAANTFPTSPFKEQLTRNGGVMNSGQVTSLVTVKPAEPELLESAEQTLGMAKLLHDLATAECEARQGHRMSIRAQVPHAKEFSRAYIASSKELLFKETGFP